ncbi:hypothetical protein LOK49_LG05G03452 [Camellia lanceoleosa]|uniref:Uncharacterized protein n=1 Tax=Camellia lanceoleosa TaxID=1840588 RepID=A0ACC0HQ58_9ERIC|nr:hypothetical protein LOK49_LG05G03452 [Camellia lanceoleosa]
MGLLGFSLSDFLNFLQARVRELKKIDHAKHTITVLLVGIPNVGKSALANSLHHIGRISAAEKGKLKHATVSLLPGETKDISSLKLPLSVCVYHVIAKVLPLEISNVEVRSNLALTGAINDCLIRETELAQYFLDILNLSDECKQWSKLSTTASEKLSDDKVETSVNSELDKMPRDHAQYKHFSDQLIISVSTQYILKVLGRESVHSKAVEKKQDSTNQMKPLEHLELMEWVYSDVATTGKHAWTPTELHDDDGAAADAYDDSGIGPLSAGIPPHLGHDTVRENMVDNSLFDDAPP